MYNVAIKRTSKGFSVTVNNSAARAYRNSSSRRAYIWTCPNTSQKFIIKLDAVLDRVWAMAGDVIGEQSSMEIKMLQKIKPKDRKYFPKLVAYGKIDGIGYVMQPFYKFSRKAMSMEISSKLYELKSKYKLWDVSEGYNAGVTTNKTLIIFDFAL